MDDTELLTCFLDSLLEPLLAMQHRMCKDGLLGADATPAKTITHAELRRNDDFDLAGIYVFDNDILHPFAFAISISQITADKIGKRDVYGVCYTSLVDEDSPTAQINFRLDDFDM